MASIDEPLLEEETGIHHVPKKIHTETVAITTGETLATTEADGMPIYAAKSSTSQPVNASTMLFVGTEDAVRGNLPSKSASGHKLHIQTYPRYDGFRKFYDQGEYPHTVLLLHRNTTRLGEFDDPLGLFFHRTRIGRVSLVFMGENDQENFAALCKLDPNIDALDKAGRVFFWNELEGTSRQKVDELVLRIQDNLGHPLSATQKKSITRGVRSRRMVLPDKTWHFNKLQGLLAGLAVLALFFSLLCSFPPIQKHRAPEITVPGAEKWTPAERATYLDELRKLERERLVVEAERNRIDSVRRKMIEKINDIEELENSINREKRNIVCGLLDRREALLKEYTSASHARDHITQLKREIARMEAELKHLPAGGREQLELERNISDRKFDVRVWEEGLEELLKVEEELARSDVFSWSEFPTYCALPAAAH